MAAATEDAADDEVRKVIEKHYRGLGRMRLNEMLILACFVVLILLWFFQRPRFMKGWADHLETVDANDKIAAIGAATPAMLMVLIVFALPAKNPFFHWPSAAAGGDNEPFVPLLNWEIVQQRLPWGVVLLLGGGLALSKGVTESGNKGGINKLDKIVDHRSKS